MKIGRAIKYTRDNIEEIQEYYETHSTKETMEHFNMTKHEFRSLCNRHNISKNPDIEKSSTEKFIEGKMNFTDFRFRFKDTE